MKLSDNSGKASLRIPKRGQNGSGSAVSPPSVPPDAGAEGYANDLSDSFMAKFAAIGLQLRPPSFTNRSLGPAERGSRQRANKWAGPVRARGSLLSPLPRPRGAALPRPRARPPRAARGVYVHLPSISPPLALNVHTRP